MPITKKSEAKEGGFAQVRENLVKFEGDVLGAEFGQYSGGTDEEGKPFPPREYLEVTCENIQILEATDEISFPLNTFSFRVKCSDYKGSFWVDMFLESADKFNILIPEGLVGKRIVFEKKSFVPRNEAFKTSNFVIAGVSTKEKDKEKKKVTKATTGSTDPMEVIKSLAVGKTEAQLRTAVALHPDFANSPLLSLVRSGVLTTALLNEGKLILVDGKYQLPE